jgi:hypothetical protein
VGTCISKQFSMCVASNAFLCNGEHALALLSPWPRVHFSLGQTTMSESECDFPMNATLCFHVKQMKPGLWQWCLENRSHKKYRNSSVLTPRRQKKSSFHYVIVVCKCLSILASAVSIMCSSL